MIIVPAEPLLPIDILLLFMFGSELVDQQCPYSVIAASPSPVISPSSVTVVVVRLLKDPVSTDGSPLVVAKDFSDPCLVFEKFVVFQ